MNSWFCGHVTKQCFIKFVIPLSEKTPTSYCGIFETFRTNVKMTARTRAPLIANHIIKYPDQSQGLLKWLRCLYPSHLQNTCSKPFSLLNDSSVPAPCYQTDSLEKIKVHKKTVKGSLDLLAQWGHDGYIWYRQIWSYKRRRSNAWVKVGGF